MFRKGYYSLCLFLLAVLCLCAFVGAAEKAEPVSKPVRVHAVSDIGHQFTFYADGRFHTQYLPGMPRAMSWGALYNYDFSNDGNQLTLYLNDLPSKRFNKI